MSNDYCMGKLTIRFVCKMMHADLLPSQAIRFSHRLSSFGGKISNLTYAYIYIKIYKYAYTISVQAHVMTQIITNF